MTPPPGRPEPVEHVVGDHESFSQVVVDPGVTPDEASDVAPLEDLLAQPDGTVGTGLEQGVEPVVDGDRARPPKLAQVGLDESREIVLGELEDRALSRAPFLDVLFQLVECLALEPAPDVQEAQPAGNRDHEGDPERNRSEGSSGERPPPADPTHARPDPPAPLS